MFNNLLPEHDGTCQKQVLNKTNPFVDFFYVKAYTHTHTHTHTHIYIYIYRERERDRGALREQAVQQDYVPGPTFGFVKLLASSGSHCTK